MPNLRNSGIRSREKIGLKGKAADLVCLQIISLLSSEGLSLSIANRLPTLSLHQICVSTPPIRSNENLHYVTIPSSRSNENLQFLASSHRMGDFLLRTNLLTTDLENSNSQKLFKNLIGDLTTINQDQQAAKEIGAYQAQEDKVLTTGLHNSTTRKTTQWATR